MTAWTIDPTALAAALDIWPDATTPRTDKPVRLVAHPCRPDYTKRPSLPSGLSSHVVRLSTFSR